MLDLFEIGERGGSYTHGNVRLPRLGEEAVIQKMKDQANLVVIHAQARIYETVTVLTNMAPSAGLSTTAS